jgi:hypothetical protein
MSRVYMCPFTGTVTNAGGNTDLLEVLPGDDKPCRLRGILLSQISEVGDAAEEGLQISVQRFAATVTSGSGGTADAAATTSGTASPMGYLGWNERNSPYDFWFPDERFCPIVKQGEGGFVRQDTTAADDYTGCFTFWVEEL